MTTRAAVVGGGLVGCLLAIQLRRLGWAVAVVEKRPDLRTLSQESDRSINLIITSRGLHALRELGLVDAALALCVPVRGRGIHGVDKSMSYQPYGISLFEVNYSVSRTKLNCLLIDAAQSEGVTFVFDKELTQLSPEASPIVFKIADTGSKKNEQTLAFDVVFGTDGVGSPTRRFMLDALKNDGVTAYDCIDRLGISYREVTFPSDSLGQYSMRADALHIWPRGAHFLMALADKTPTFTGTLYLPDFTAEIKGLPPAASANRPPTFEEIATRERVQAYVDKYLPDVPQLVPDVVDQLLDPRRPHSFLGTLRCTHWHFRGKVAVLGDAAHGVVPFFGQGMNLGFESAVVLLKNIKLQLADKNAKGGVEAALARAFAAFQLEHQTSATAIANMAIENFSEMSFKIGMPAFLKTKAIENELEARYPTTFRSRYYMVTKTLIPYRVVYRIGVLVDRCVAEVEQFLQRSGFATVDAAVRAGHEPRLLSVIGDTVTKYVRAIDVSLDQPLRAYYDRPNSAWEVPIAVAKL